MTYDVIVIGVGGMGSATVFHLAAAGAKVLGLEQFTIPHDFGSSHGSTRIIRLAYSEGDEYVPLLRSAYQYWGELEQISGKRILFKTGGLDVGPAGSWTIEGSRKSCRAHGIPFEELEGPEVNRRFPGYRLTSNLGAIYQRDGGYVLSELAVKTYADAARVHGAEIHEQERVLRWESDGKGVRVVTAAGEYQAARLVLTAGPWTGQVGAALRPVCQPERQVLLWTEPREPALFEPKGFPVFNMECPEGRYYGFPNHQGEGFKIGRYHHLEQMVDDPGAMDRECGPEDEAILRLGIARYFPGANGAARRMTTCIFTNSPNEDFFLDRYPGEERVFVAAGFSGHGFKFCSVVGRIMTDFSLDRTPAWELGRFSASR